MDKIDKSQRLATLSIDLEYLSTRWNDEFELFSKQYKGVAVAASGGVDSTVLFKLIYDFSKQKINFDLSICHVNFGLRGKDSDEDQSFLEDLAKAHGVRFFSLRLKDQDDFHPPTVGIQAWAREIRKQFFAKLRSQGYLIALAHNRDDLAENVVLRLARGASPENLLGMQVKEDGLWRPLLAYSKEDIYAFAHAKGIDFREDQSNASLKYARNRVRLEVLPALEALYPGAKRRMVRCSEQARGYAEFICASLKIDALSLAEGVSLAFLHSLPNEIAKLVLSRLLGHCSKKRKSLSDRFLERVLAMTKGKPFVLQIPGGRGFLHMRQTANGGILVLKE